MKRLLKVMALALALVLALSLAGCGDEAVAETESNYLPVTPGGSIDTTGVEGLDQTARMSCAAQNGTMYAVFNGIRDKSTDYFRPGSDTITVVCQATSTSDSSVIPSFRLSLWMMTDDGRAQYVGDAMTLVDADGSCYTISFSGLDTSREYKLTIGYATATYYLNGALTVSPLATEELTSVQAEE